MIPLRGTDPAELALSALIHMGAARMRPEVPSGTSRVLETVGVRALETLGVRLAAGERLSGAEVGQLVGLVRTALDIAGSAVRAGSNGPAGSAPTGVAVLLREVQAGMRELQHVLLTALGQDRELMRTLAPLLRQLALFTLTPSSLPADSAASPPHLTPTNPAPSPTNPPPSPTNPAPSPTSPAPSPTSAASPVSPTPPPASPAPAPPSHAMSPTSHAAPPNAAPWPAKPGSVETPTLAKLIAAVVVALTELDEVLPKAALQAVTAPPAPAAVRTPAAPASPAMLELLQTLAPVVADLEVLLPAAESPAAGSAPPLLTNLTRELTEALEAVRPAPQPPIATPPSGELTPVTVAGPSARLATAVAEVIEALEDQPPGAQAAFAEVVARLKAALPELVLESRRETAWVSGQPPAPSGPEARTPAPTLCAQAGLARGAEAGLALGGQAALPAGGQAGLALGGQAALPAHGQAGLALQAALAGGALAGPLEPWDAYRWALLAALNYRSPRLRTAGQRLAVSRCETCGRVLERTLAGALICPHC